MHTPETVTLTNMCMIEDGAGRVVVQERRGSWPGFAFPGGHVELFEPLTEAVIREVHEETGLTISHPRLCGMQEWIYPESGKRYMVFLYRTGEFRGELTSSAEGQVRWVPVEELSRLPLCSGMEQMLRVFLEDDISEMTYTKPGDHWITALL